MTSLPFAPPALGTVLSLTGLPGGGNKIHDKSPYGSTGTITGATWKRLPSGLWCLYFDGSDDYVDCGNKASLRITGAMTLKAWMKTSTDTYGWLLAKWGGTSSEFEFGINDINMAFVVIRKHSTATEVVLNGTTDIHDNVWHHLVLAYDGSAVNLYVDTISEDNGTYAAGMDSTAEKVLLGKRDTASPFPFDGYIALPEIHNRAWCALEVANSYNREKHLFGV